MKPLTAGRAIKETVRFTVRPRAHSPYRYDVLVFASERAMQHWARETRGVGVRDSLACCITTIGGGFTLGEILFTRRRLTPELIAHEATHAAHSYLAAVSGGRKRLSLGCSQTTVAEERVADAAGRLVAAITRELRRRGMLSN